MGFSGGVISFFDVKLYFGFNVKSDESIYFLMFLGIAWAIFYFIIL